MVFFGFAGRYIKYVDVDDDDDSVAFGFTMMMMMMIAIAGALAFGFCILGCLYTMYFAGLSLCVCMYHTHRKEEYSTWITGFKKQKVAQLQKKIFSYILNKEKSKNFLRFLFLEHKN